MKNGFRGKVYCTEATRDLCAIILPDSGRLQEEEAAYTNRHGYAKHHPALPLYTQADAEEALRYCVPVVFERDMDLGGGLSLRLSRAGHILVAAYVLLRDGASSVLFSGDLGRPHDPIMPAPAVVRAADYLVIESTYGDRRHDAADPQIALAKIIHRTVARGGVIVVRAFVVSHTQTMLYYLYCLKAAAATPNTPVFLNSPMAVNATHLLRTYPREHRLTPEQCEAMCDAAHMVNSVEESKALNRRKGPLIIISASGMATGGRVLHHLKAFAPDPRHTILFVGYQAGGTGGAAMVNGAVSVKMHGAYVPVRTEVVLLENMSAHADSMEIMDWLGHCEAPPRRAFVSHGEAAA